MAQPTVDIRTAELAADAEQQVERLVEQRVASALAARDPALWGEQAQQEAAARLGWVTLPETSRPLLYTVDALRAELRADGIDRVVLSGMGGSSLAPEVIAATGNAEAGSGRLTVLDSTDPGEVGDALAGDLDRTVLVVSSKSGSTVETDSHRRVFAEAFADAGLDPARHLVAITDPGSPLQQQAQQAGYRAVFEADPTVGGRYSALSAFGLVPAGLAGADIGRLLDDAGDVSAALSVDDPANPALRLAAALAAAHQRGAEKIVLADTGSGIVGFADWAEQLIAESTGKQGVGLLPIVVESPAAAGFADAGADAVPVGLGPGGAATAVAVTGTLGGQFLLWEHAVAIAGRLLGVNPFDQPDVEAAKSASRALLETAEVDAGRPEFIEGDIVVYAAGDWLPPGTGTVGEAVAALLRAAPDGGYLAVQAFLNRLDDASATVLRSELARRSAAVRSGSLQTTFGWGPRFLHSTGQYHKGGRQNGVFLQLSGDPVEDLEVPGRPFTFGMLQRAQALGDAQVLAQRGRPVLRLHFTDRAAGLVTLVRAVQQLEGEVRV
ncbi:MAG: glucose-6-phosphate isomerase [Pseudonocardiaceae bacterium]|nr:glucose-6-phosphate isomerase [Pseudonocardiaceae bacterium]